MKKVLLLAVIVAMLGCATVGSRQTSDNLKKIKEGETTKIQVVEILGPPSVTTLDGEGREIYSYHHSRITPSAQNFIPLIGLVQSKVDVDTQMVQVLISKDGIVQKITSMNSASTIKSGIVTE